MMPPKWKLVVYGLVAALGCSFAAPNFFKSDQLAAWPRWLPTKQLALGLDLQGGAQLILEMQQEEERTPAQQAEALKQSVEIVRKRIDAIGVAESVVQALGADRILVQLPGVTDPTAIRNLLGSTAKLSFHRVLESPDGRTTLEAKPMLKGERLVQATASYDQTTGLPVVTFKLDAQGAKEFAAVTRANVGKPFAIVLDGKMLSAPVIEEPILTGSGQIRGHFTAKETATLAALLRAGALPVPLKVLDQGTVTAELGEASIRAGTISGAIGMGFVLVFMVVVYRRWGWVANLALIVNVALTLAVARFLGVTLTLPGIAGIVLSVGLAVDANVLINERIREETRHGKSAAAALQSGFKRAYAAIVDSNVTTLIATALLFFVGTGPVQGFAITMALGIAISMFTAVSLVQAVMAIWIAKRRPSSFEIRSLLPKALTNWTPTFAFMRARFVGIGVSLVLSVASIVLLMTPGLNYGIDFTSGIVIEAELPRAADLGALKERLQSIGVGEVTLQRNAETMTYIRLQQPANADDALRADLADTAKATIKDVYPDTHFQRTDVSSAKISSELADQGILAVILASVCMLIYIWIRFEWHFAVGAIATLVLDITKVAGFFAVSGLEFNMSAIAALLTLIGYSVNDKVVVYDRMRENLKLFPSDSLRSIIDRSINETLARSIYTSATAFLAMLPMAIWGGTAVRSFAIPVVVGIAIAASSSVFIAAPILLFLGDWRNSRVQRGPIKSPDSSAR